MEDLGEEEEEFEDYFSGNCQVVYFTPSSIGLPIRPLLTFNRLKDHDVTWLYGPLQPGFCALNRKVNTHNGCQSSISHSGCQHKKPILKKRSLSELMLRRSVSSASLLKDAATAEAQKSRKLAISEYNSFILATPGLRRANTTGPALSTASGSISPDPDNANKNVRFHDLVEQCIALTHLGDDEPEYHYVSDSDDEAVVIRKPTKQKRLTKQRLPPTKPKQKAPVSKTIEKLPHAPLKCPLEAEKESPVATPDAGLGISPCLTQERKPSPPPSTISLSRDNSACDDEEDEGWEEPSWLHNRKDSVQIFHDKLDSIKMLSPTEGLSRDSSFLHRPVLERNEEAKNMPYVTRGPTIKGRDARISFELLPCRSQLAAFSFSSSSKAHHEEDYMIDPADSDDEGWAENIDASPSSSDYFSTGSDNDSENSRDLQGTSAPTTKAAAANEFLIDISPRESSDSGYGSEEAWRVRDESQLRVEQEKGVKDWDLYHDWDEVDEAVAWQREF
jgi:hypothetical protein